jgi:exopolysaccharide biosynthesis protein
MNSARPQIRLPYTSPKGIPVPQSEWRRDGTWVLVVVDGRQPQLSRGMTLQELAGLMSSLGCGDALNLDGGGSSTLYIQGSVVNSPSDAGIERPVSDAILIFRRRP